MPRLTIAKTGFDAETGDSKNQSFDSRDTCLIEFDSAQLNLTTDGSGNINHTITHNLGYVPEFDFFQESTVGALSGYWIPAAYNFNVYATTTQLVITTNLTPDTTYKVFYKIYSNRVDNAVGTGNNAVSGRLRISKNTYNAETEQDPRNMEFFSGKSVQKLDLDLSGSISGTTNGSGYLLLETDHNLNYVPELYTLWQEQGETLPYLLIGFGTPLLLPLISNTKFRVEVYNSIPNTTHTFKYKILRDKII
jgi:hypothetical protein